MRLIDADCLKQAKIHFPLRISERFAVTVEAIDKCPTIDAAPVVRGRWVKRIDESLKVIVICSICNDEPYRKNNIELPNYCPNCSAKMEGEENDG